MRKYGWTNSTLRSHQQHTNEAAGTPGKYQTALYAASHIDNRILRMLRGWRWPGVNEALSIFSKVKNNQ